MWALEKETGIMKVVILAGGLGSRLSEETDIKPKAMVEIGGHPILWHIMNIYAAYDFQDFLIALGYKGEVIKEYFLNFYPHNSDITVNLATGRVKYHNNNAPDWTVMLVDTGIRTETGGRIKRLRPWLAESTFMMTYGDGVGNVDLKKLLVFHKAHGKLATMTGVHPPSRFGSVIIEDDQVVEFREKPQVGGGWINGGFFVLEPGVFDYIKDDSTPWEASPLQKLTSDGQLMVYRHDEFWQPMDTLREKRLLQALWDSGNAPWKVW